ncbi:MAG: glycoside hydrolase family 88 protein [Tidjanibacter sp.]|nr:glycoside hydrolase family 88 protein [Tidjanibacter sp.]
MKRLSTLLLTLVLLSPLVAHSQERPVPKIRGEKPLSMRMVESEMSRIPDAITMDNVAKPKWNYTTGLELLAIMDAGERYQMDSYTQYALSWLDRMVEPSGEAILTYKLSNYNLDHICPGRLLYRAYDLTAEERYRTAMGLMWRQLQEQPRTPEGGYWHKKAYPNQMWLDGLYMAEPFKAEYLRRYATKEEALHGWEDIVRQFVLVAERTYDPATGLFRHAWDSSKQMFWCDPTTGQSQHAWLRAMGWYTVALVEVLDYMPAKTAGREKLIGLLNHIYTTIDSFADPESGMWYQVMDCPTREGNYEESTGSIMLTYAMLKASRQGYLPREYRKKGAQLYEKFVERFMRENPDGTISMIDCCAVGGLGGKQNRMGDFAYYLSEPIIENDCKGVGPFIWASMEYEALHNIDYLAPPTEGAVPAFPGAEGGGMWTTGGRGGKVLKVTKLTDDGSEGTLRWALNQKGPRMILFDVAGTIHLESMLHVTEGNFTLAGESAPGEGVCIAGHDTRFEADNIIVRHLRFRLGDKTRTQEDALEFRKCTGAIVDHCSVSWSVDECASCYGNRNFTMQYCLIAESLNSSTHKKGNHGYGGIWGGRNATFHHNLLAHHTSRNPRLDHPFLYWGKDLLLYRGTVELYNNTIYNWRDKACYGGEEGWWIVCNNLFIPGPDTKDSGEFLQSSIYPKPQASNGHYHISGNIVEGNDEINNDNWQGVDIQGSATREDIEMAVPRKMWGQMPYVAHLDLLSDAGVGAKPEDKTDLRILAEVFTKGGSIINSQDEVGGWPKLKGKRPAKDSDGDGLPDRWERRKGLNPKDCSDGAKIGPNGYSILEEYLHEICTSRGK